MEPPSSSPPVEVERLNAEIDRLSADLERANEDIRQVLYAASHDLAEPLQIVLSYAELLSSRCAAGLDDTGERYLEGIQTGATRIRKLIDGLLAYSRLERLPSELAEIDCSAVVDEALYELATSVERTGATVAVEALPTVRGVWTELVDLFERLLENALEFRATEPPRIRISASREQGHWCFSVRDNGIGVHHRQHERIFEIFQRLHTRSEHPGTGLGLAICRKIVERHGGRIWVESRPGLGSTFRFTLPASSG